MVTGNEEPDGEETDEQPDEEMPDTRGRDSLKPKKGTMTHTIPMPEQRQATLQVPVPLTGKDFTFLTTYLALMKDAIVGEVSAETKNLAEQSDE